jgi:hypothetical protein
LQLGATDESHIIRTIEYWESQKRTWPKRSHTAVLVAEGITNRFFNVVHLLSMAVPIIGIQANIVQVGEARALHFHKVIDSYEEPDEPETQQPQYDERHWVDNYSGTLECAKWYKALLERLYGEVPTRYFESYISLSVNGVARVWINERKNGGRAFVEVKYGKDNFQEAVDHMNSDGISFKSRDGKFLNFNVSAQQLKDKATVHEWLASRLSPESLKLEARAQGA